MNKTDISIIIALIALAIAVELASASIIVTVVLGHGAWDELGVSSSARAVSYAERPMRRVACADRPADRSGRRRQLRFRLLLDELGDREPIA
jgi:hypothetical protein